MEILKIGRNCMSEKDTDRPGYYAIIPASVRYDKSLTPNAKLLYGEITALCSKEGFCWAANEYFSELYEVSERSISAWIKQLAALKYIEIEYEKRGFEVIRRKIMLSVGGRKLPASAEKNFRGSEEENFQYINTKKSNTSSNTGEREEREADASLPPSPRVGSDGTSRFEKSKKAWPKSLPAPTRKNFLELRDDDRRDILATMSHYSDDEIAAAMKTYAEILPDPTYDIFSPYSSMVGFLRAGVEKFVDEAKPRESFLRVNEETVEAAKRKARADRLRGKSATR
jgi:hypothetical protein